MNNDENNGSVSTPQPQPEMQLQPEPQPNLQLETQPQPEPELQPEPQTVVQPEAQPVSQPISDTQSTDNLMNNQPPKKNNSKNLIIFAIIGVIFVAVAIAAVMILLNGNKSNNSMNQQQSIEENVQNNQEEDFNDDLLGNEIIGDAEDDNNDSNDDDQNVKIQRDIQRRNDMARFVTQINQYQANNRGRLPHQGLTNTHGQVIQAYTAFINEYLQAGSDDFKDPLTKNTYYVASFTECSSAECVNTTVNESAELGEISVYSNAKCINDLPAYVQGDRKVAFTIMLESGDVYCVNN